MNMHSNQRFFFIILEDIMGMLQKLIVIIYRVQKWKLTAQYFLIISISSFRRHPSIIKLKGDELNFFEVWNDL
jgi:hypothetical protein